MAKLIYSTITSLDGYVADTDGGFDWAAPDAEVHAFVNDLERSAGTYLYGRRMYEVMAAWEHPDSLPDRQPVTLDFAEIWRAADKVVYSTTLRTTSTARTRIERGFDPDAVRWMKATLDEDITVGGPGWPRTGAVGGTSLRQRRRLPPLPGRGMSPLGCVLARRHQADEFPVGVAANLHHPQNPIHTTPPESLDHPA